MENRQCAFVFVVIPLSEIKKFVVIDIIGGTVLYYALKLPFHSVIAATAGSMVGPLLIRRSLKRNRPVPFSKR
ncbi:hypothetical protein KZ483_10025 [Paenibacillus sp. sptzw28]|uniref:hypothetical protein n=1 Tax=Paenibacillus sp. sptzw28 TaxID=715179 RepID=UPI001C6EF510|nr:hypothetical protein [Paenibacillus sp. sptzw28]QYR23219.1 hypothetical protein KZ483_10025 [Paenibacillus sp. sptzw28]